VQDFNLRGWTGWDTWLHIIWALGSLSSMILFISRKFYRIIMLHDDVLAAVLFSLVSLCLFVPECQG
jgi:hypothetical protein